MSSQRNEMDCFRARSGSQALFSKWMSCESNQRGLTAPDFSFVDSERKRYSQLTRRHWPSWRTRSQSKSAESMQQRWRGWRRARSLALVLAWLTTGATWLMWCSTHGIQNFRSFSFVWGIVCLNRCHRTVTRQKQKCFKTSGTPCR